MQGEGSLVTKNELQSNIRFSAADGISMNTSTTYGRVGFSTFLGLALLFASPYFLERTSPIGLYLLPTANLFRLIVLPSLVALFVITIISYAAAGFVRKLGVRWLRLSCAVPYIALIALVGVKAVFLAAGHDWRDLLPSNHVISILRGLRFAAFLAILVIVWITRGSLARWCRLLSSLGLALGLLAAFRIFSSMWSSQPDHNQPPVTAHENRASVLSPLKNNRSLPRDARSKRVVWLIFDETDFNFAFSAENKGKPQLPNFSRLAETSVFATNANSPASATIYSIPSLLTGIPVSGIGVRSDSSTSLSIQTVKGNWVRVSDATTIFGAIRAGHGTSSVLGFYHPYCKLFQLESCDSFAWPSAGGWGAALQTNLPDSVSANTEWDLITRETIRLLPEYIARDDELTFVHLNFPHPPADFADRLLNLTPSGDPLTEYSHNLMLADRILGETLSELQQHVSQHDTLLVVSTDHWLRNRWYRPGYPDESRRVPFIVWKVGDTSGHVVAQPVSTIHTAAMIMEYLNGNLESQEDIARWLSGQPYIPSYIAPPS